MVVIGQERRRRVVALVIATGVVLLFAAFAYRPATVIGVDGDALAHDLGGGDPLGGSHCQEGSDGHWYCVIPDAQQSGEAAYAVETHSYGCWDAERDGPGGEGGTPRHKSGCLNLIDYISPF
jgi:hypothetical protein